MGGRGPRNPTSPGLIPAVQFRDPTGQKPGLLATFFSDQSLSTKATEHATDTVDLYVNEGGNPRSGNEHAGQLQRPLGRPTRAPRQRTVFLLNPGHGHCGADGQWCPVERCDRRSTRTQGHGAAGAPGIQLEAGKSVPIKVEWRQGVGEGQCRLLWVAPASTPPDPQKLLDRVRQDGTTLILLDNAADWMGIIRQNNPSITYNGSFIVGRTWAGGVHFVRQHPLFKDLPVNDGMNWPYQAVVRNGNSRSGLLLEGDELVAGEFHANTPLSNPPVPISLGTAVGVIPCGRGRIIVSTLDISSNLPAPEGPADVARKLLCNFIEYGMAE